MRNKDINRVAIPLVLIAGIFIGGVAVLRTKGIGAQILSEGKKVFVSVADDPEADPDNDGLKNWQEKIYKTDARNPDTDGDGYLDGEEVASGYDPTIPSPNDALSGTDTSKPRPLPNNFTDHLADLLKAKIMNGEIEPSKNDKLDPANDPSISSNEATFGDALSQVGQRAEPYFELPIVSENEINTSTSPATRESIDGYIKQAGEAMFYDNIKKLNMSEADMIKATVETNNTDNITTFIGDYQKTADNLKAITVPRELAGLHKKHIAIFELFVRIFESIKDFQNDPVKAMAAMEAYPKAIDRLQSWNEDLAALSSQYQKTK